MNQENIYFSGFDLETRKKYTKCITETISNTMVRVFGSRCVAGLIFVLFLLI